MPVIKSTFKLVSKRALTHDVFELVFESSSALESKAGEYVIFDLAPGIKRAYSIGRRSESGAFVFIVKRVSWGAGSPVLCGLEIGSEISGMGPMGHFVLRETDVSKCFIWTGTGFAPLYYQLLECARLGCAKKMGFVFGVRTADDVFYQDEIRAAGACFSEFVSQKYLSQTDAPGFERGYVTDFLTSENVASFQEFYLCGSPAMVKDAREKLEKLGISKERVFFEQY